MLGYLLATIFGNILEIIYIYYVSKNVPIPEPGHVVGVPLVWPIAIALVGKIILPAIFILITFKLGAYFWQVLYVEKKYKKWWK